jgi:hypothetical protein
MGMFDTDGDSVALSHVSVLTNENRTSATGDCAVCAVIGAVIDNYDLVDQRVREHDG